MRAFVIAMESEAAAIRPRLCADDRLYVSGIGKALAAAATMKAICDGATEIWNVGLSGGFGPKVEIGGVYEVARAVEWDFDLDAINGKGRGVKDGRESPYVEISPTGLTLATGDRFADDPAEEALVESFGAELRDMEGAAIAEVCRAEGVPLKMYKCVCDIKGRGSMTGQYASLRDRCLAGLDEFLQSNA